MSRMSLTIGLLWHSVNSDNLGVGALTVSQIEILKAAAAEIGVELNFRVLGWKDQRPVYVSAANIENVPLRTRDLVPVVGGFAAEARRCDIVLDIGAGDSFSDIYGVSRFIKTMSAKFLVLAARRPLVFSPQTLGPYERPWARRLALVALRRARAVFTRDALSTGFAREIGFEGALREATDVALRLPYEAHATDAPSDGKIRFGLNVSGLLLNGGWTGANEFKLVTDHGELIRSIIAEFAARDDCEMHLVGHVISDGQPIEDDQRAAARLGEEFPQVIVAPKFASPSEAKSYISGMDFFAGARMHACIAAFSSGVPVVPMAYSRKFAGLFGTLGYERTVDCRSDDAETILAALRDGFENRAALKAEVEAALTRGRARLDEYQAVLAEILREVAAEKAAGKTAGKA